MAFDQKHYLPVLKAKAGELRALREASPDVRAGFTPLLEIMEVSPKWIEGEDDPIPSKSDDAHIKSVSTAIMKNLGPDKRFFIDGYYIEEMNTLSDEREPMSAILDDLRRAKAKVVPVTGLDRNAQYSAAIKQAVDKDGRGLCLRLWESDLQSDDLEKQLATALKYFGVATDKVDLLIDFADMILPKSTAVPLINSIPKLKEWRTFTLASCAFPVDMSGVAQYSIAEIPRDEWTTWTFLRAKHDKLVRMPTFGDYTINHPEPAEIDPRKMRMSGNIRYTSTLTYVVAKGEAFPRKKDKDQKAPQSEQYPQLAQAIMEHSAWCGAKFSWGDSYIEKCAKKECVGGGTEWRAVGTSHHLAFVAKQLASLP